MMKHKLTLGFSPTRMIRSSSMLWYMDESTLEILRWRSLKQMLKLNEWHWTDKLDVTKISYNAYAQVHHSYQLLNAGSALRNNCGPLLISKKLLTVEELQSATIAIPGNNTANFLMSYAYPDAQIKQEFLFSEIESAVLNGKG